MFDSQQEHKNFLFATITRSVLGLTSLWSNWYGGCYLVYEIARSPALSGKVKNAWGSAVSHTSSYHGASDTGMHSRCVLNEAQGQMYFFALAVSYLAA